MTLDEIITKCNIGEDHLTQEEYEQVGRWLEDYKAYEKAFEEACWLLAKSIDCFGGYCPIEKNMNDTLFGCRCPDCSSENMWKAHFLQRAREE